MRIANARLLDEAALWMARQYAPDFSEAELAELLRWRKRSADHEEIWQHMEQLKFRMDGVPAKVGMAVLDRARADNHRRRMLRTTALALATPMLGWFSYRQLPWQIWNADFRTATGETREVMLADSSQVLLNTASAISARFDSAARRVRHLAGEILVQTSHASRYQSLPFIVETGDGELRALGTRFIVRKHAQSTALSVLQGAVQVMPSQDTQTLVVQAGEQVSFDAFQTGSATPLPPQADAWVRGVLHAHSMRLVDFLAELQRYRQGVLRCDPEVAELRVSGVFQLRDTDRILQLLTQTLPVRAQERTRYWVTLTRS
ncbi:MAG: FecR domain-containing protein [Comamonas sp.]|jgi:transmembrane sensor|uniref:FecR domain-containing protein n=1 Tax=Comamonas sp. TaxID=34028 RepID=UPI002844BEA5|nr:FecR domain-containing protein [Comamonas sp.]MDR3064459.1 FecR domain-containing protein [Comamonas sp.]